MDGWPNDVHRAMKSNICEVFAANNKQVELDDVDEGVRSLCVVVGGWCDGLIDIVI